MIFGHQADDTQNEESTLDGLSSQDDTSMTKSDNTAASTPNQDPPSVDASQDQTPREADPVPAEQSNETAVRRNKSASSKQDSTASTKGSADQNDLLTLKLEALHQLTPLVHQLDQNPEERFRTTMMMIQSTDNQTLIKDAYAAAQSIGDDKTRAQALLDVINEINYFTQQKK